jgi:hypothetical protein
MKTTVFWNVTPCYQGIGTERSEKSAASFFGIEEAAMENEGRVIRKEGRKLGHKRAIGRWYL